MEGQETRRIFQVSKFTDLRIYLSDLAFVVRNAIRMVICRIGRAILTIRIRTLPPRHEFRIDHGQGHEQEEGNE